MFSLHAFDSSIATTSTAAYANVVPVADQIATVSGNLLYVGGLNQLLGAFTLSANIGRSKLESPTLLNFAPLMIAPYIKSALPTQYENEMVQMASPIKLTTNEALQAYALSATSGSDAQTLVGVLLGDGAQAPVSGEIHTVRATFTSSATADSWQNGAITFDTVIPAGSYDVVGARAEGSHLKVFRLVFQGNTTVRPGTLAALGADGADLPGARYGGWGTWGTFDQFTPPSVDHITDGTSETVSLYLDLIKKS